VDGARAAVCALALLGLLASPGIPGAAARQSVHLSASLTPERLGAGSTIGMAIRIAAPARRAPAPVREIDLRYPNNLGIAVSGLGLETCTAAVLEAEGPAGCPADSFMGRGTALAVVPFGPELIHETAHVTIVRAEDQDGFIALLFDAQGLSPVRANIVLAARLLPSAPPYGGRLRIEVPLIPSLPEAPPVAVIALQATLGPQGLTYYESSHGEEVPYTPKGILLPDRCPPGGFPFATALTFEDGGRASARTTVRCPGDAGHRRSARR
jgi:hypothetical protein